MLHRLRTALIRAIDVLLPPPAPTGGDDLMALADCLYDDNRTIRTADLDTAVIPLRSPR